MAENDNTDANASKSADTEAASAHRPDDASAFPARPQRNLSTDITQILKEIKLPERRSAEKKTGSAPAAVPAQIVPEKKPPPETPPPAAESGSSVVALHTLKDDMQHVVQVEKMSLVRAASLEQDRADQRARKAEKTPGQKQRRRRVFAILLASAVLVGLGIAALAGVAFVVSQHMPQRIVLPQHSLIFAEQNVAFPLEGSSPDRLKQNIIDIRDTSSGSLGSITRVVPTMVASSTGGPSASRPATTQEFLRAIGAHPPDELLRALGDDFFFGIHTVDKNAPVFVISVLSYEHAFAGLLEWESSMDADLAPIFASVPAYTIDKDAIPHERRFDDAVMRNYDVRILRDDNGAFVLYYSFPAPNLLVIAESPYSFPEIITRLRALRRL